MKNLVFFLVVSATTLLAIALFVLVTVPQHAHEFGTTAGVYLISLGVGFVATLTKITEQP